MFCPSPLARTASGMSVSRRLCKWSPSKAQSAARRRAHSSLPLVPAFRVSMAGEAALSGQRRARTITHTLAFVLGFSAVFTLLWVAIALVGALAGEMVFWLQRAGGLLLDEHVPRLHELLHMPLVPR